MQQSIFGVPFIFSTILQITGTRVIGPKLDADDGSFFVCTGITFALSQEEGTVSVAILLLILRSKGRPITSKTSLSTVKGISPATHELLLGSANKIRLSWSLCQLQEDCRS